jgi:Ca-activated chloride channel family protein
MSKALLLLCLIVSAASVFGQEITEGSLFAVDKNGATLGACPLKKTTVKTEISGFLARVRVVQQFENSYTEPIEAVYTFPLSQNGAVDEMTMTIGDRIIHGKVMKRAQARAVYNAAKTEGKAASLLDQERPNIFTQSVANIMPGESVTIEISYVETLKYEDGTYEFVFPMTVAPRYTPANADPQDTANISPPLAASRDGHTIAIDVDLNAGVPIEAVRSDSHRIQTLNVSANSARISLADEDVIPNKDFVLRYDVTGKRMEDAVLVTRGPKGGFFSLILTPPEKMSAADTRPKEIVFVLDTSGSMEGFPIEKAKESMKAALDGLYPNDTFNLITFAGDTHILFDKPVPATRANLDKAQAFLESRSGDGGTEMMDAVRAALEPSDVQENIRIVCFMTDGEVGDDMEIIAEVKKHPKARVFSFGIGDSVNRFLLDSIAREGRGDAEYVLLEQDGTAAAKRFHQRIRDPYLTDISIDWNGLPVSAVYPGRIPDLFGAKPVIVYGKYSAAASGTIKLKGNIGGQPFEREVRLDLPASENANGVLSTLWARTRIDDLMSQSWDLSTEESKPKPLIRAQIEKLGTDYGLLTQYTSFVAVEERIVNQTQNGRTVRVPVYAPAGTVFENEDGSVGIGNGVGSGTGSGSGIGSGNGSGTSVNYARLPSVPVAVTGGGGGGGGNNSPTIANSVTVEVTGSSETIDATETKAQANIKSRQISSVPKGTGFTSLLRLSPSTRAEPLSGQFSVNGSVGPENSFIVDGQEVSNYKAGVLGSTSVAGRSLVGQAMLLPKPVAPPRSAGTVSVAIKVDGSGNVVSAIAAGATPRLRAAAQKAALASKFSPVLIDEKPVGLEGVLRYQFLSRGRVRVYVDKMRVPPPTPEMRRVLARADKLHTWIFDLVERLEKGVAEPTPNEAAFVSGGKASISIDLFGSAPAALQKIKLLGFEPAAGGAGTRLKGRIPIKNLAALADLTEVKLILPRP